MLQTATMRRNVQICSASTLRRGLCGTRNHERDVLGFRVQGNTHAYKGVFRLPNADSMPAAGSPSRCIAKLSRLYGPRESFERLPLMSQPLSLSRMGLTRTHSALSIVGRW